MAVQTNSFDFLSSVKGYVLIALGAILIVFGLLSISLGIGAICTLASGYYIGYGIWCGILFIVSGVMCVFAGYKKNVCLVMGTCICCILTTFLAVVQIAIGITAARDDSISNRENMLFRKLESKYKNYDIYYELNYENSYLCSSTELKITWEKSWGPIDVLLILSGFVVFFVSMLAAFLSCNYVNQGKRIQRMNFSHIDEKSTIPRY